ncbi:hypothetical protein [Marinimicrobium alkaliphilum]|uniref:hypothetical protein n=1 Tax=Marinimicrobium alkaliphilum TaxID=2202654 RepID=UPI00130023F3|nr:hypothetical protein [Marinimicrobium alkaliphilum]
MFRYFGVVFLAAFPSIALACSCLHAPLERHVSDARDIYVGVLVSSRVVESESGEDWPHIEGTLRVETVIKGSPNQVEIVRTGFGGGDCGIPMTVGRAYVIFIDNDRRSIGNCGASEQLRRYEEKRYIERLKGIVYDQTL